MDYKKVVKAFDDVIRMGERILEAVDENEYKSRIDYMKDSADVLRKEGHPLHEEVLKLYNDTKEVFGYHYMADVVKLKPFAERMVSLKPEADKLRPFIYQRICVSEQYYHAKALLFDELKGDKTIRYIVASFFSEQEMRAMLSNLQKGIKRIEIGDRYREYAQSVKNGYRCLYSRTQNENVGDGVHAIIYHEDERVLKIPQGESSVDKLYKYISTSFKTGLIPEWKEYFYNSLSNEGLLTECEGFDYTGRCPKIMVISEDVNQELIMSLKREGLESGAIILPVENNVEFNHDASFYELVTEYVIPHIQEEEVYYKVGDPIDEVISSPIDLDSGKEGYLYPRQQILTQGFYNAFKAGVPHCILNGEPAIGKTFIAGKLSLALAHAESKSFVARIALFAEGRLLRKWKRQLAQIARPLGVVPNYIKIHNYKDIMNLSAEPNGFEVYLLSKDKVKRSYQIGMATNDRLNRSTITKGHIFATNIVDKYKEKKPSVVIENINDLALNTMKWTATFIEKSLEVPVILYKEQLDEQGKVRDFRIVTTSDIIKKAFADTSFRAYDFELPKNQWNNFVKEVKAQKTELLAESEGKNHRRSYMQNGLVCSCCGGLIYNKASHIFDSEKYVDNVCSKPNSKSKSNSKCNHYVKADGTPLMSFEIRGIRRGQIAVVYVDANETVAYVDEDGNPLQGQDLFDAKANEYEGNYRINVKKCGAELWSAIDKKGYRVVNSIELLKERFGNDFFLLTIADESHILLHESSQGMTYHQLVLMSKYVLNLTGTLTGGKASDIFYTLYRLYPQKMKDLGYGYDDVNLFVDHYGRRERVTKESADLKYNKSGYGRRTSSWQERAGISPLLYTNFLSGIMVSRSLEDMQLPMPPLFFYKHEVEMSDDLKDAYDSLKKEFVTFMNENKELPLGGSYLHNLLAYPDHPNLPPVYWAKTDLVVATPRPLKIEGRLLPKEKKLVETIKREISEGRKVLVYSVYSGGKGVSERLMNVLLSQNIKAIELKSSVPVEDREEWIERKDAEGYDVIVTNPTCVATGLDIIQFQTVYFYECPYSIMLLRQAERRPYRVSQPLPVRIYYSYYKGSLQEDAIKLIGAKKKASLALEGVFSEDLLSSMSDVSDNGAKLLFDVLKGKIKLKETDLDAFRFSDETLWAKKSVESAEDSNLVETEIELVILTEKDLAKIRKSTKRNVSEGQLYLFAV
jgi:hypothetical protein